MKLFSHIKTQNQQYQPLKSTLHSIPPHHHRQMSSLSIMSHQKLYRRSNQLSTKPKLVFGLPFQSSTSLSLTSQTVNTKSQVLFPENNPQKSSQSLQYRDIKPIISWKKYSINLCSQDIGIGQNGCSCQTPCQWLIKWTVKYRPKHAQLYQKLPVKFVKKNIYEQILRDVPRTLSYCPTFKNEIFQEKLKQILVSYAIYDNQIGYAQGMNMIVAVLLYHIKHNAQTFWAFVDIMEEKELRLLYTDGLISLKSHTKRITSFINKHIPQLSFQLEFYDLQPSIFLYGWLLSLMSNCIHIRFMHIVIDNFRKHGWQWLYKLMIVFLLYMKVKLIEANDSSQFLELMSTTRCRQLGTQWIQIIDNAHKFIL